MKSTLLLIAAFIGFSTASQAQWQAVMGIPHVKIGTMAVADEKNMYAGIDGAGALFQSTDTGATWQQYFTTWGTSSSFWNRRFVNSMAVSGNTLFVATDTSYYTFRNGNAIGFASNLYPLWAVSHKGAMVITVDDANAVYVSTDTGKTFGAFHTPYFVGLHASIIRNQAIILGYYGGSPNIFTSYDSCKTFIQDTLQGGGLSAFAENGSQFYAANFSGVWHSIDNGKHWLPLFNGLPNNPDVSSLTTQGNYLFAGCGFAPGQYGSANTFRGVYLSTDSGANWHSVNANLPDTNITSLAINGKYVYVGTNANGIFRRLLSDFKNTTPNGIAAIANQSNSLQVYPNPANQSAIISLQSVVNAATIKLINITGQTVIEKQNQSGKQFTIDLSTQAAGIYFVEVQQSGVVWRGKVVKE